MTWCHWREEVIAAMIFAASYGLHQYRRNASMSGQWTRKRIIKAVGTNSSDLSNCQADSIKYEITVWRLRYLLLISKTHYISSQGRCA
eukprot:scaffold179917_cov37-Prasinocladus_malaysianus.AAC.1